MVRRLPVAAGLVAIALALAPTSARAQLEPGRAVIAGTVRVQGDTVPLSGVEVYIVGSQERTFTDALGAFRFTGIYPGRYEVRARRLGYEELVKHVTVAGGEVSNNSWSMHAVPQHLAEVRVNGQMVRVPAYLQDAYRRVAMGFGDFILPDDIARRNPSNILDMFEGMIPGAHLARGHVEFARCTTVGGGHVQVYLDGQKAGDEAYAIPPSDIALVEVYRGVARIPGEFLENACAVVAIWTKRG